jgi:4-carboxymuconolactone decarboxylase
VSAGQPHYDLPDEVADDVYALLQSIGRALWSRQDLTPRERSMITIASTAALGQLEMLGHYIRSGLADFELTPQAICGIIMQTGPYGGMPRMVEALGVAKRVFEDQ